MKKICKNCQYCRDNRSKYKDFEYWCSNSKSKNFRYKVGYLEKGIALTATCEAFSQRGKKASIFKRILIKIMGKK